MKTLLISLTLTLSSLSFAGWDNPAVLCPEEILPKGIDCLDLSQVKNPYTDFPSSISDAEKKEWIYNHAADLNLCRSREVLARESRSPGAFTPLQVELSWMIADGGKNVQEKLNAVMVASQKHQIPPQVLIGALTQESLLASLSVSSDGGNYSCGIAQLNLQEWCTSIAWLPYAERQKLGWPSGMACEDLPTSLVKPFHDIALSRLGNRPEYKMTNADFDGITQDQVQGSWPQGSADLQTSRFQAVTSFLKNCQNISLSIPFKAQTLKGLFSSYVPLPMKLSQMYKTPQSFPRRCAQPYPSNYYPLHTGWLLAVAAYNAGPRQTQLVEHYFQIKDNKFPDLSPLDLIEALHWGGQVKPNTNNIFFIGQNQTIYRQPWYKSCVVQRHVARVIQHVTIPGQTIARSLEQVPCAQGPVPKYRRNSSGVKAYTSSAVSDSSAGL